MRLTKWPFRPTQITNDGERSGDEDLRTLTGEGIISNVHLQGIQTQICANLENPTTVVEFSPENEPVRTDSRLLYFALHPPCRVFREFSYQKWCLRCDNQQALLLCDLAGDDHAIFQELSHRIGQSSSICRYARELGAEFDVGRMEGRPFLAYDCPLLGYRELLFPVIVERRVVGAFFVGSLSIERKLDFIARRQAELSRDHEDYFREFLRRNPESSMLDIVERITRAHAEWIQVPSHVLSETDYTHFIRRSCSALEGFEMTLRSEMRLQRERYVAQHMDKRIRQFRANLPHAVASEEQTWLALWWNIQERLSDLISDFAVRYFVVFGVRGVPAGGGASTLEVVGVSNDLPDELRAALETLRFNLDKIGRSNHSSWVTTVQDERLFLGIEGWDGYSSELNVLRLFPIPFIPRAALVILVGFHDWNPSSSPENRPGGPLSAAFQSFYAIVLSALSSLMAATAETRMEAAVHIFGHETGQLAAGLDWLRESYLSDPEKLRTLDEKKAHCLCRDVQGYLSQLLCLSKQPQMLVSVGRVDKAPLLVYREVLLKWTDAYSLEAERKSLQFHVRCPAANDPLRGEIYADRLLLEQLAYNLVTNAVKYSYRGTKISLDCAKTNTGTMSPHILTVTDYGMKMEGGERAYELYWRGTNTGGLGGLGIGLFVARQIIHAHGGTIAHTCEKISEYNIPLLKPCLSKMPLGDKTLVAKLEAELDRLEARGDYDEAVAIIAHRCQKYNPTTGEIMNSIRRNTWRVTFTVTIPAKE